MKIGTILENEWTTSTLRYGIYIGTINDCVVVLNPLNGFREAHYYKKDVGENKKIHPLNKVVEIKDFINTEFINYLKSINKL